MTLSWLCGVLVVGAAAAPAELPKFRPDDPAWTEAHRQGPLSADETRVFMRELAKYVFDHHLKTTGPQRGMLYEYYCPARQGQVEQYVQGEALDTMHDGAWMASGLAAACRTTGEAGYRQYLTAWLLPFYLKMLNHSDMLFDAARNDARPDARPWGREWKLQPGERGFVPYFWDDGGSMSLERCGDKNPLGILPCADFLKGQPNPQFRLNGYSLGSSNHMALDLGVMLQQAWLLLHTSADAAERKLAAETAEAAQNLYECRMRHYGLIPICATAAALATGDAKLLGKVALPDGPKYWTPGGHYRRALYDITPGATVPLPGFADDQLVTYHSGIARTGGKITPALARRTIYDAFTGLLLYRYYSDDAPVPAGINRFDLHPISFKDGKPLDYRSDRRGPWKQPRPIGSRMGAQNMTLCGLALQMLRAMPGVWEGQLASAASGSQRVFIHDPAPRMTDSGPQRTVLFDRPLRLEVWSTRHELCLEGEFSGETAEVKIFGGPTEKSSWAVVKLSRTQPILAANDRGESLVVNHTPTKSEGGATRFSVRLPYTVVEGQGAWANGVEFGTYLVQVGGETRPFVLATSEQQVAAWLEHELGAGLRTWRAIYQHCGYIPTGLGTNSLRIGPGWTWDAYSDSGSCGHLLAAGAQWLLCLEGKRDWELQGIGD